MAGIGTIPPRVHLVRCHSCCFAFDGPEFLSKNVSGIYIVLPGDITILDRILEGQLFEPIGSGTSYTLLGCVSFHRSLIVINSISRLIFRDRIEEGC